MEQGSGTCPKAPVKCRILDVLRCSLGSSEGFLTYSWRKVSLFDTCWQCCSWIHWIPAYLFCGLHSLRLGKSRLPEYRCKSKTIRTLQKHSGIQKQVYIQTMAQDKSGLKPVWIWDSYGCISHCQVYFFWQFWTRTWIQTTLLTRQLVLLCQCCCWVQVWDPCGKNQKVDMNPQVSNTGKTGLCQDLS